MHGSRSLPSLRSTKHDSRDCYSVTFGSTRSSIPPTTPRLQFRCMPPLLVRWRRGSQPVLEPIHQPRHGSVFPIHGASDLHAVAFIKLARDLVFLAHTQVEVAARWLHDFLHELPEHFPPCPVELPGVEDLMQHDRACRDLHRTHGSPLPVLLVCDHHAVLPDAMVRLDPPLQRVLPDVREHVPVGLEMPVDRLEIANTRVAHGYFFLNTKIGSLLKALLPRCFNPTILLI